MELRLILCDIYLPVVWAWEEAFAGCPNVEVCLGDLTEVPADAYVSAANSLGDMSGGVDWALRERFGDEVEERVISIIAEEWGRLPVGSAIVVPTDDSEIPYLVVAPTMTLPAHVADTDHAYLAMTALLQAIHAWNEAQASKIRSVAIPGLCTGTGTMPPAVAAGQMRKAYDAFLEIHLDGFVCE